MRLLVSEQAVQSAEFVEFFVGKSDVLYPEIWYLFAAFPDGQGKQQGITIFFRTQCIAFFIGGFFEPERNVGAENIQPHKGCSIQERLQCTL